MNRTSQLTVRGTALLGALLTTSFGALTASGAPLEEVVTRASRADVVAAQARFDATMDAYAVRVDAALKTAMRKRITEQARPKLRVALASTSHRG